MSSHVKVWSIVKFVLTSLNIPLQVQLQFLLICINSSQSTVIGNDNPGQHKSLVLLWINIIDWGNYVALVIPCTYAMPPNNMQCWAVSNLCTDVMQTMWACSLCYATTIR